MRTNSKVVREQVREHIIDSVYTIEGEECTTFDEARIILNDEFNRVANYPNNLKRIPNDQERFSDYLCGLPFHFEYTHTGIAEFLNGLGINPTGKEYTNDESMRLYHYMIWREIS